MTSTDATRRAMITGALFSAAAVSSGAVQAQPSFARPPEPGFWRNEYRTTKQRDGQAIELAIYRKRTEAPRPGAPPKPVLFLVHGSSNSSMSTFDLVLKDGAYSSMNAFAKAGFDVWTMDHENYGRSARTNANSDIASGAEDLRAASDLIRRETGLQRISLLGHSSGGLRAAVFASKYPDRVDRLGLGAYTYTGKGSPTLAERAKQLDFFRANIKRTRNRDMIRSIFTRDRPGTADPEVAEAMADQELIFGESVPTGTYLDMTANLPVVQPQQLNCPVLMIRGEYDGIATNEDLLDFYGQLPNGDKHYVIIPATAHTLTTNKNRAMVEHVVTAFMKMPTVIPV
jgi:pimeloyl-ACP methyl ester carboxylesterase